MVTFLILKLIFREINNKKNVTALTYDVHILIINYYLLVESTLFNSLLPLMPFG